MFALFAFAPLSRQPSLSGCSARKYTFNERQRKTIAVSIFLHTKKWNEEKREEKKSLQTCQQQQKFATKIPQRNIELYLNYYYSYDRIENACLWRIAPFAWPWMQPFRFPSLPAERLFTWRFSMARFSIFYTAFCDIFRAPRVRLQFQWSFFLFFLLYLHSKTLNIESKWGDIGRKRFH